MAVNITDLTELLAMADDDLLVVRDASEVTVEPVKKSKLSTLLTYLEANLGGFQVPWTELAVTASTSGTTIDFTSIPAGVKEIEIWFHGASLSGSSSILVQLGTGGSPTTSGYAASSAFAGFSSVMNSTAGFPIRVDSAARAVSGKISFYLLDTNDWISSHSLGEVAATYGAPNGGGAVTLAGELDNIRITTVNGTDTFDAGQLRVRYR
jgi:hypothetical protein